MSLAAADDQHERLARDAYFIGIGAAAVAPGNAVPHRAVVGADDDDAALVVFQAPDLPDVRVTHRRLPSSTRTA